MKREQVQKGLELIQKIDETKNQLSFVEESTKDVGQYIKMNSVYLRITELGFPPEVEFGLEGLLDNKTLSDLLKKVQVKLQEKLSELEYTLEHI